MRILCMHIMRHTVHHHARYVHWYAQQVVGSESNESIGMESSSVVVSK